MSEPNFKEIKEISGRYLMNNYKRQDVCFTYGSGELLYDSDGKSYIDLVCGIATNALGHADADWVEALREQADKLTHTSNLYYNREQAALAQALVQNSLEDGKVMFINSGTEANEAAFKIARRYGQSVSEEKFQIISLSRSFHGRTFAAMNLTGQESIYEGFGPRPGGFFYVEPNHIEQMESAVSSKTAAIILELVQGEGGVFPLEKDYVQKTAQLAKEHDVLLIVDEIQTGMGRTGSLFAYQQYGIQPDIITLAKGLGGGFPIGAVIAGGKAADVFQPGDHGSTFGGNHLACAVAYEVLKSIQGRKLLRKVEEGARLITSVFEDCMQKYSFVQGHRGLGYLQGLVLDSAHREAYGKIPAIALSKGLVLNVTAGHIIRIMPALTIDRKNLEKGLGLMVETLEELNQQL